MRPRVVDVFASRSHATFLSALQPKNLLSLKRLESESPDFYPLNWEKTLSYERRKNQAKLPNRTTVGALVNSTTMNGYL